VVARHKPGIYYYKKKNTPGKIDVFSFVLCTQGTPSLAPLHSNMRKIMVYKTAYVTWCCYSMIVVSLGFPCLYFALSLAVVVVRQSRFAPWPLSFLHAFTAHKGLYTSHIL
jgi:hypothetical protein